MLVTQYEDSIVVIFIHLRYLQKAAESHSDRCFFYQRRSVSAIYAVANSLSVCLAADVTSKRLNVAYKFAIGTLVL